MKKVLFMLFVAIALVACTNTGSESVQPTEEVDMIETVEETVEMVEDTVSVVSEEVTLTSDSIEVE